MTKPPLPHLEVKLCSFNVLFLFISSVSLFVCFSYSRGRTRGRVVVDEEDSMDGTEITESIDPQDTGETLFLIFYIHIGFTESDI